ncbi:hypothetical protein B9Z19DRAFT_1129630 [Tuber borchii]|uniref:Uncharacterized protein n=1 Tax=Tuber borchii TaxID=42251 RepID=A0A2T6ZM08_TUBBO|nr:hypothetical protein B9Z19DRAFT_1129630 [Tuber borchii]
MNPSSSSSRTNAGKQPENSEEGSPCIPNASFTLYPLYEQAEATKAKIERTVSQLPRLAAQADEYLAPEYLAPEMANVTDVYFDGIASEDPADAQKQIEEAIVRMDAFYNDLSNRMRANNTSRNRAFTEPGPRPPWIFPAGDISCQTGESSANDAGRQQLRSLGILPGEPENDLVEHGPMHPGERVFIMPPPPARRVTFGDSTIIGNSPTGPGFRRSLTFRSVASALKRNPGESKREKVKDLWRNVRDRLKKNHDI